MAALARRAARGEDFSLASWDGAGYLRLTVARDPLQL